ncbi:uncharacterized protein [Aristolochia californica]|uniref:uncharacterized protein n=1 Tax=Aristolochia californica TaxID=171875 RepID=UPI0035E1E3DF
MTQGLRFSKDCPQIAMSLCGYLYFIMSSDKLDFLPIHFTGKNYPTLALQFHLFVMGKELCGHIDGSDPAPREASALSKWTTMDVRVMTWILSSVEPHFVINLWPYRNAANMWNYLHKIYNQNSTAHRFQWEYEMAHFTQGSLSIEEYYSGFQNLWADYAKIIYENVPIPALSVVQAEHETNKRVQFLMKLRSEFEIARSNLMNRHLVPSLDIYLSELLREEQRIATQIGMEHRTNTDAPITMVYAEQGRNQGRDMKFVQCSNSKEFGHFARDFSKMFCR